LYGIRKVSRTFKDKNSRAADPAMGHMFEIVALLFNPLRLIVLLHQNDCESCENIVIYFLAAC